MRTCCCSPVPAPIHSRLHTPSFVPVRACPCVHMSPPASTCTHSCLCVSWFVHACPCCVCPHPCLPHVRAVVPMCLHLFVCSHMHPHSYSGRPCSRPHLFIHACAHPCLYTLPLIVHAALVRACAHRRSSMPAPVHLCPHALSFICACAYSFVPARTVVHLCLCLFIRALAHPCSYVLAPLSFVHAHTRHCCLYYIDIVSIKITCCLAYLPCVGCAHALCTSNA
jgi:hypothetical protein